MSIRKLMNNEGIAYLVKKKEKIHVISERSEKLW